jgi:hypothetical protein
MTADFRKTFNDETAFDRPDRMTAAEYDAAFKKMFADYLNDRPRHENPLLLYVTGVPGAGKSRYVSGLPVTKNAVVINFDDLRVYHPRYEAHVKDDPLNAAARIDIAVESLIAGLCEEAARRKINVILDDAAMGQDMTKIILTPFRRAGFRVETHVVVAPEQIAKQSVSLRFERDFAAAAAGKPVLPRWVNETEQQQSVAALLESVAIIENEKLSDVVYVVDRKRNVHYNSLIHGATTTARAVAEKLTGGALTQEEASLYDYHGQEIERLKNSRHNKKPPGSRTP